MRSSFIVVIAAALAACSPGESDGNLGRSGQGSELTNLCKGVVCTSPGACIKASCDPSSGQCVNTPLDGTSCNDGQACTMKDVCQAGSCVGTENTCGMSVVFSPAAPLTGDDVTASLSLALDPALSVAWSWSNAATGATATGPVLSNSLTSKGDHWKALATVTDAAGTTQKASATIVIGDSAPAIGSVQLAPASPARGDTMICSYSGWSDPDGDAAKVNVAWFVQSASGPTQLAGTALKRKATDLAVGAQVYCEVTPRSGAAALGTPVDSNPVTVIDLPPAITSATITDSTRPPTPLTTFTCVAHGAKDPDGDALTTTYAWFVNGAQVNDASDATGATFSGAFWDGQSVNCQITVSDGFGQSASATSAPVVIQHPPPTIAAVTVTGGTVCQPFTCAADGVVDPEGNPVTLHYHWLADGAVIAGQTTPTLAPNKVHAGQTVVCSVRGDDGALNSAGKLLLGPATDSAPVTAIDNPPQIASVTLPAQVKSWSQSFTCSAQVSDDCDPTPALTYAWQIDGQPVANATASTFTPSGMGAADTLTCSVTASDGTNSAGPVTSNATTFADRPPVIAGVSLTTADGLPATRASSLVCAAQGVSDPDGDTLTLAYLWTANGAPIAGATSATFAGPLSKGEQVSCTIAVSDGQLVTSASSPTLTVLDTAPAAGSATVVAGDACGTYSCQASGFSDADGDALTLSYRWFSNGDEIDGATSSSYTLASSASLSCAVTASDGTLASSEITSPAISAVAGAAAIVSVAVSPSSFHTWNQTFSCEVQVADNCGTNPQLSYAWNYDDWAYPGYTDSTFLDYDDLGAGDTLSCTATLTDGSTISAPVTSADVMVTDQPPTVQSVSVVATDGQAPLPSSTLSCNPSGAYDPDGDPISYFYGWYVNGNYVQGDNSQTLAGRFNVDDRVYCQLIYGDGIYVDFLNSSPVTIQAPEPNIASAAVQGSLACSQYQCVPSGVSDPQGKSVTLHYRWMDDGNTIPNQTGASIATSFFSAGQNVSCGVAGDDGTKSSDGTLLYGNETLSAPVVAVNIAPTPSITLPATVHLGSTLTATVINPNTCAGDYNDYEWTLNGQGWLSTSTPSVSTAGLPLNAKISVTFYDFADSNYGSATSNVATVTDQPPVISGVAMTFTGARPTVASTFTCSAQSIVDPDGDGVSRTFITWYVNGKDQGTNASSISTGFKKGDQVSCAFWAYDGLNHYSEATSDTVTVLSALPTVASVSLSGGDVCQPWLCNVSGVSDLDGDPVALDYTWYINGQVVPGANAWQLPSSDLGAGDTGYSVSCSAHGDDGTLDDSGNPLYGPEVQSSAVSAFDNPPNLSSVNLPASAHPGATLTCSISVTDDCVNTIPRSFSWTRNGAAIAGVTSSTLSTTGFNPGDAIVCTATASDGLQQSVKSSNTTTLQNHAPAIASVSLTTKDTKPSLDSTLTCAASGVSDSDGDSVTTAYSWQINGSAIAATGATLAGAFHHGDQVTCTATASDKWTSTSLTSSAIAIQDLAPAIASVSLSGADACGVTTCTVNGASDPDGDALSFSYTWFDNGAQIANATSSTLTTHGKQGDSITCAATASDGALSSSAVTSAALAVSVPKPSATAQITPAFPVSTATTFTCNGNYSDECGAGDSLTIAFFLNGTQTQSSTSTPGGNSGSATWSPTTLKTGDQVSCSVTAQGAGGSATATSATATIPVTSWTMTANIASGKAGYSVAVADDLNGDGFREVVIGAPNTTYSGNSRAGAIYLVNGQNTSSATALGDLVASLGPEGEFQPGDHGNFALSTMVCNSNTQYAGGCPTVQDIGNFEADSKGPDGAGLGFQVAFAGDLDGDGVGDLLVSAPYDQVSDVWTGRVFGLSGAHLLGRPFDDAMVGLGGFTFDGECGRRRDLDYPHAVDDSVANGDLLGWKVTPIGDANGDGLADFAVSAPNSGDDDQGTIYVVYGRSDKTGMNASDLFARGCNQENETASGPLMGSAGYALYSVEPSGYTSPQLWGAGSMTSLGDLNGDGYDDFLIANAGQGGNLNYSLVLLGGANAQNQAISSNVGNARMLLLNDGSFSCGSSGNGPLKCTGMWGSGFPAGGGGDMNGDGYDDIVAHADDFDHNGWAQILYGGGAPDSNYRLQLSDALAGNGKGFEVTAPADAGMSWDSTSGVARIVGDINGDGYDDAVIGIPNQGGNNAGAVYVIYGAATPPTGLTEQNLRAGIGGFALEPGVAGAQFGWSVSSGDIDGDGLVDLVIGAPGAAGSDGESGAGAVSVVFGAQYAKNVTFMGTPGDDTFTGTAAGESIIGGRGNDHLIGGGGADVIYGGAGDDLIEVDDDSFRRVNGGPGNDTLVLGPRVSGLSLSGPNKRRIQEIERIQLSGQAATVSKLGIAGINGTGHKLELLGNGAVNLVPGDHWVSNGTAVDAGVTYLVLQDGVVQLWIASGIRTSIPPTVFNAPLTIPENGALGSTVATLRAVDPDGDSSAIRWQLLDDPSSAFSLDAQSGALIVIDAAPLDYEAFQWPWTLTVQATDSTGLVTQSQLVLSLSDVPEAPVFPGAAPIWDVFEDAQGLLGTVTALDEDQGDSVTYSILDTSGLFAIDPKSGAISLIDGKVFNPQLQTSYLLPVTATDTTGLTAQETVSIQVLRKSPLTHSAHVEFDLRDWSIFADQGSASFPGLEPLGPSQEGGTCLAQKTGANSYSEPWTPSFLEGPASLRLPLQFQATYTGSLCMTTDFKYDSGTVNASVPYDITFSYPDQIKPGQTMTISSTATPSASGPALWGVTPGFQMTWTFQMQNWGALVQFCNSFPGTSGCDTIFNKQNITTKSVNKFGLPPDNWTGAVIATTSPLSMATTSEVHTDASALQMSWSDWIASLFQAQGLPTNVGTYKFQFSGGTVDFDYDILSISSGVKATASYDFGLDVGGITATMTLEDGSQYSWPLGSDYTFTVPSGADVNGDGRVDLSISLALNSTFHTTWNHNLSSGYFISGGYGRVRALDILGNVEAQRQLGPAYDESCAASVTDPEEEDDPFGCWGVSSTDHYSFTPHGFSTPVLKGGLPLSQ